MSLDNRSARDLQRQLGLYELRPVFVDTEQSALLMLAQWQFEAIVIDMDSLPTSIFRFLESVSTLRTLAVLVLSSPVGEDQEIDLLAHGATELLKKPITPRLIAAKLRRFVNAPRASDLSKRDELRLGPLAMNPSRATASVDGLPLVLTSSEFNLLFLLASSPGVFFSRDAIGDVLPRQHAMISLRRRSADMHVSRLRRKLQEAGAATLLLESAYGRGYRVRFSAALASQALPDTQAPRLGDDTDTIQAAAESGRTAEAYPAR